MENQNTQLDPQVVNLARAIRKTESNDDFTARSKDGSFGAYQFVKPTWDATAKKYGVNAEWDKATPAQQNEVAYKQLKEWKDKGYNVGQIASMWNAGEGKPNAYKEEVKGINEAGVKYNVPEYAKKVATTYQQIKSNGGYNPKPFSSGLVDFSGITPTSQEQVKPKEEGLGGQLLGRTQQAGEAIQNTVSGKINPISGVLQTVGAGAGAVGDIVNKGLELIPGVKQVEDLLGEGIGKLAETPIGQSVTKYIQEFTTKHPELSADIGAGFNIATAIPILRGLGAIKNIGADVVSQKLKGIAVKGFEKDLAESATTKRAKRLFTPQVVDTIVKTGATPDIEDIGGKLRLNTEPARELLENKISKIDDEILQPALKGNKLEFPIEGVENVAKKIAIDDLHDQDAVVKAIQRLRDKYGDKITIENLNKAKRDISRKISEARYGNPDLDTNRIIRKALQTVIEDGALQFGLGDVAKINKTMAELIKASDFLESIQGNAVAKRGLVHGAIQGAATLGGEAVGNMAGTPLAGAYAGNKVSGIIERKLSGLSPKSLRAGIIKRSAQNTVKDTVKQSKGKIKGLVGGALAQKANR